mmetsp:Transcript_32362/g.32730  ORF Transcript_32362/g.32730 Transcript_32362/m.32730 type:complete len:210 (+) Transcript_32362:31-660(+)
MMMSLRTIDVPILLLLLMLSKGVSADNDNNDIVLYACGWVTNRLNAIVAKQIISTNILQDSNRSVVIDESITSDKDTVLAFINGTSVPPLAAALEIWPGAFEKEANDDNFEQLGEVGLVALTGWYVPGYFVEQYPEAVNWEFYTRNETAKLFATEETAPLGRFLGIDPGKSYCIIDGDERLLSSDLILSSKTMPTLHLLVKINTCRLGG